MALKVATPKFVAALAFVLMSVAAAQSQSYPTRPITLIVPFPAGGPTDTIARIIGDHMKGTLNQWSSSRM